MEPAGRRRSRCAVRDGEVVVRDHGPGIDEHDLPYVFDRFYRGALGPRAARARVSGSRSSARSPRPTAGTVVAERANGGGTLVRLSLPTGAGNGSPQA